MANGKVALATVPVKEKKEIISRKKKIKEDTEIAPRIEAIQQAAFRCFCAWIGCVVFMFEFFAGGFEGACKAGMEFMQGKGKEK